MIGRVPGWKLRREWNRLREQVRTWIGKPFNRWRQQRHDAARARLLQVLPGALALGPSVAIVLIYQPEGLPGSILHTLAHLRDSGFAPVAVLNAPLPDADLARLAAVSALIVRRPNFGYDYGGFRDAILHLLDSGTLLDRVVFLNDSVWFPVFEACDHLHRMAAIDADLVGYAYAQGMRRHANAHVQSYLFMFQGAARLRDPAFHAYWRDLSVANSRHHTIRHGEMRMTTHFRDLGWRIGWLFSADSFRPWLEGCDAAALRAAAQYYIDIGTGRAAAIRAALDGPAEALRALLLAELAAGTLGRNTIAGPPGLLFGGLRFAAMKKSAAHNYLIQRRATRDAGLDAAFAPPVRDEIARRV